MIDYQYNPANQLTREVSNITGVTRYRYDANGNMIQKRHRWRTTRYVYDIEDRLRLAFGPEGLGFYLHDALGRRILRFGIPFTHKEAPSMKGAVSSTFRRSSFTRPSVLPAHYTPAKSPASALIISSVS